MSIAGTEFTATDRAAFSPARWRRAWLGMDANPVAISFAGTLPGVAVIHLVFFAAILAGGQISRAATAMVAITLVGCALQPTRRLAIMAGAGLVYMSLRPFRSHQQSEFVERMKPIGFEAAELPSLAFQVPMVLLFLVLCTIALALQKRFPASVCARRPVLAQFFAFFTLAAIGAFLSEGTLAHSILWTQLTILGASFFFLSYALADNRSRDDTPMLGRLGFLRPFWSGPSVPFKSPAFLKRFEANDPQALAAVRLRALKLSIWALVLVAAHAALSHAFYEKAGLPTLDQAIVAVASGEDFTRGLGWGVVAKNFVLNILSFGAIAHTLVAIVRMAGFGIPRHMARPLSSRTIAEFWNRYVYYFKEVLVDFFFYPAFLRWFKKSPRLRIAFATFCAAFVGNILFSVVSQAHLLADGPAAMATALRSYSVYALALTLALIASQLRNATPRPEHGMLRYHVLPRLNVLGFFALAQIFADESGTIGLEARTDFFLRLFGA
ncbi:MAG: hypothetical protein AB7I79_23225 [Rhizobiaceae bacterium]